MHRQYESALTYYDAAQMLEPTSGFAAFRAGNLALECGQYETAIQKLLNALSAVPDHTPTTYLLARAYAGNRMPVDALKYAERTLQNDPNHAGALLLKLRSLADMQKWEEIRNLEGQLPTRLFEANEVYLWSALAHAHSRDTNQALQHYSKITEKTRRRFPDTVQVIASMISIGIPKNS